MFGSTIEKALLNKARVYKFDFVWYQGKTNIKSSWKSNTFNIDVQTCQYKYFVAIVKYEKWSWHLRYDHLSWRNLEEMSKKEKKLVHGLVINNNQMSLCSMSIQNL